MIADTEIDVVCYLGNVMLREWEGETLIQTHTMTPSKAKSLSSALAKVAYEAEKMLPKKIRTIR